jgi:hypothetical protein
MTTLSSLVITRQAATIAQVDEALACQVMKGGDLGTCLLELGAMKEEVLLPLLSEAYGMPAVAPGPLPAAPLALLRMVPHAVALTYGLYPIGEAQGELHLAVVEPLPAAVEEDLSFALGAHIKQFAATSLRVRQALARDYGIPLERRFARLLAAVEQRPDPSPTEPPPEGYRSHRPSVEPPPGSMSLAPRKRTWPGMLAVREAQKPAGPSIPQAPAAPEIPESFADLEGPPSSSRRDPEAPLGATNGEGAARSNGFDPHHEPPRAPSEPARASAPPGAPAQEAQVSKYFVLTPSVPPVSEHAPTPIAPPVSEILAMATPDSDPPTRFSEVPATLPTGQRVSAADHVASAASDAAPVHATSHAVGGASGAANDVPLAVAEAAVDAASAAEEARPSRPPSLPAPPHDFVMEAMMATAARVEKKRQRRAEQMAGKALLGWARRAAGSAVADDRAKDRRRGPLTPASAELQLEDAVTGDEALGIFFAFARQYFEYSALFVVHGDLAAGYDAWGPGASRDKVRTIGVALDLPNALSHARQQGTAVIAPLQRTGLDADLRSDFGRTAGRDVFVLPIMVRQRCVALLYGDQGFEPALATESAAVVAMVPFLAAALERIVMRKKRATLRQSLRPSGDPPSAEPGASVPPAPPAPSPLAQSVPPSVAAGEDSSPDLTVSEEEDDGATSEIIGEMASDSLPPPSGGDMQGHDPLASASMSASPHPPPASRAASHELPRVLIRADLVDQVIAGGEAGERALGEILALGVAAIPSVFARFPGPLTVDRNQAIGDLPRPADCGPVLRIIATMRRLALPFLAVRSADSNVEVRFWATYLLGELNYADVSAALVPRLFDENPAVRRIAVRSARTLAASGNEGVPLRKALERTVSYAEEPEGRRLIALWTIGELRLFRSIPTLIAVVDDPIDSIAEAAQRSLTAMTRQDFGRKQDKWREWWETKGRKRLP